MRAVLDPNVLISALPSRRGAPARVLRSWIDGEFELLVSSTLLDEVDRALTYPRLRKHIPEDEAKRFLRWLSEFATLVKDSTDSPPVRSDDPGDDYLLALAGSEHAVLISGDKHLLDLVDDGYPIYPPAAFLDLLDAG